MLQQVGMSSYYLINQLSMMIKICYRHLDWLCFYFLHDQGDGRAAGAQCTPSIGRSKCCFTECRVISWTRKSYLLCIHDEDYYLEGYHSTENEILLLYQNHFYSRVPYLLFSVVFRGRWLVQTAERINGIPDWIDMSKRLYLIFRGGCGPLSENWDCDPLSGTLSVDNTIPCLPPRSDTLPLPCGGWDQSGYLFRTIIFCLALCIWKKDLRYSYTFS